MQLMNELGHVVTAKATGGAVQKIILHPLAIATTHLNPNPEPLYVAWGGFAMGGLGPLIAMLLADLFRLPFSYLWHFFAGFCLVGNGFYLVGGALLYGADPGELMKLGVPQVVLIIIGLVAVGIGFSVWNRLGVHFGFGDKGEESHIEGNAVVTSVVLLAVTAGGEWLYSIL